MADDPREQASTEDIPTAMESFTAGRPERREDVSHSVSRAAALLALVRPKYADPSEYRRATEEARELVGVDPVEPFQVERGELASELARFGAVGERAARHLREEPYGRRITDDPGARSWRRPRSERIVDDLEPTSRTEREAIDAAQREAAEGVFGDTGRYEARHRPVTRLVVSSLLDEEPLVRVAAAAAALRIDARNPLAEAVLDEASSASDDLAELSRAVLLTDRQSDARIVEIEYPQGERDPSADSTLIHGTWARWGRWWRPGGDLFRYLRDEEGLFPHLYSGPDPFRWSGYFSFRTWPKATKDWNRQQAADSLAWWTHRRLRPQPDIVGHSYGGSLAMMATQSEKSVRGMVLLSPAVHRTCLPDPSNYAQVLHVTMKLDLVLLADLSQPRLLDDLPNVTRLRLPRKGLAGHSATHNPRVWQDSGLTPYVKETWLSGLPTRNAHAS